MKRTGMDLVHALGIALNYVEDKEYELYLLSPRTMLTYEVVYSENGCSDYRPLHKFSLWTRATRNLIQGFRIVTGTETWTNDWIVWVDENGEAYGEY